jgi:hypothetical protein
VSRFLFVFERSSPPEKQHKPFSQLAFRHFPPQQTARPGHRSVDPARPGIMDLDAYFLHSRIF